jgi:hypothetical protein
MVVTMKNIIFLGCSSEIPDNLYQTVWFFIPKVVFIMVCVLYVKV